MVTGSINDNFRNAYFAARTNLHTFLVDQLASVLSMSYLLFAVSPSIHKKSKLQTTNYCWQKLPFRYFRVLSSLQQTYFLFINITYLFNSITFCVYRHGNWKGFKMEKCWDYFSPLKPEEEIPGCCVACIYYSKIQHLFKKQKKLHRNYLCKIFNNK